jgi:hypothetical protein
MSRRRITKKRINKTKSRKPISGLETAIEKRKNMKDKENSPNGGPALAFPSCTRAVSHMSHFRDTNFVVILSPFR